MTDMNKREYKVLCVFVLVFLLNKKCQYPRYLPGGFLMSRDMKNKMGSSPSELSCFATV